MICDRYSIQRVCSLKPVYATLEPGTNFVFHMITIGAGV